MVQTVALPCMWSLAASPYHTLFILSRLNHIQWFCQLHPLSHPLSSAIRGWYMFHGLKSPLLLPNPSVVHASPSGVGGRELPGYKSSYWDGAWEKSTSPKTPSNVPPMRKPPEELMRLNDLWFHPGFPLTFHFLPPNIKCHYM